jgi:hypothetical protein
MTLRQPFASLLVLTLVACGGQDADDPIDPSASVEDAGDYQCPGRDDGGLEVVLSGAVEADINWGDDETACGGHYIEQWDNLSVSFQGQLEDGQEVSFIITAHDIAAGETGTGFGASVTIMPAEGLYDSEDCTADITKWDLIDSFGTVDGVVRCDDTLPKYDPTGEGNDPGISIGELVFRGAAA